MHREPVDLLFVGGRTRHLRPYLAQFKAREVVLSSSIPSWQAAALEKEANALQLPCTRLQNNQVFF